jgi:leucyl/phenylalanyl-tRNA--protein transferase
LPPREPPPSRWALPDPRDAPAGEDIVGVGADLAPGTLLAAYRKGLFPMPVERDGPMGWWSPDPRGVVPLDGLVVSRSLRRSLRRFEITFDTAPAEVIDACGDPHRPHGWITDEIRAAYLVLHELGWMHSVETWSSDGALVGGLYGVAIAGLFAGESMFHRETDASKVALVALVDVLRAAPGADRRLLDVQWTTPHLVSLGAVDLSRADYLNRLPTALACEPVVFPETPAQPGRNRRR